MHGYATTFTTHCLGQTKIYTHPLVNKAHMLELAKVILVWNGFTHSESCITYSLATYSLLSNTSFNIRPPSPLWQELLTLNRYGREATTKKKKCTQNSISYLVGSYTPPLLLSQPKFLVPTQEEMEAIHWRRESWGWKLTITALSDSGTSTGSLLTRGWLVRSWSLPQLWQRRTPLDYGWLERHLRLAVVYGISHSLRPSDNLDPSRHYKMSSKS